MNTNVLTEQDVSIRQKKSGFLGASGFIVNLVFAALTILDVRFQSEGAELMSWALLVSGIALSLSGVILGRGRLLGILGLMVLGIPMCVIAGTGLWSNRQLSTIIEEYTSTAPQELPKIEIPDEKRQALKKRLDSFRKAIHAKTPTEPLELTGADLNVILLEEYPDLRGKIYFSNSGADPTRQSRNQDRHFSKACG